MTVFEALVVAVVAITVVLMFFVLIRHDLRIRRQTRAAEQHLDRLRAAGLSDEELRIEEVAFWRDLDPA